MNKYILLLITILCWGIWGVLEKKAITMCNNVSILLLCYTLVSLIINAPIYYTMYIKSADKQYSITSNFIIILIIIAALSAIANACTSLLIKNGSNTAVTLALISLYPIVTLLISYVTLKESITTNQLIGMVITLIGVILIEL